MTKIKDKFNKSKPTPSPFSLRLSFEERKRLEHDAAGLSLGEYIRQRLFTQGYRGDDSIPKRRTRGKFPVKDHKLLSQLLGQWHSFNQKKPHINKPLNIPGSR